MMCDVHGKQTTSHRVVICNKCGNRFHGLSTDRTPCCCAEYKWANVCTHDLRINPLKTILCNRVLKVVES
jgi:hypothetical protein